MHGRGKAREGESKGRREIDIETRGEIERYAAGAGGTRMSTEGGQAVWHPCGQLESWYSFEEAARRFGSFVGAVFLVYTRDIVRTSS